MWTDNPQDFFDLKYAYINPNQPLPLTTTKVSKLIKKKKKILLFGFSQQIQCTQTQCPKELTATNGAHRRAFSCYRRISPPLSRTTLLRRLPLPLPPPPKLLHHRMGRASEAFTCRRSRRRSRRSRRRLLVVLWKDKLPILWYICRLFIIFAVLCFKQVVKWKQRCEIVHCIIN